MALQNKITFPNRDGAPQVFSVDEYDDHILLRTYMSKDAAVVDIPSFIGGKPVAAIGENCFFAHEEIITISFPETLQTIGMQAFGMCKGLTELIFPDSVHEIESYAFRDCTGLRKIVLPANLKTLKTGVFSYCCPPDNMEIVITEGLEVIESQVFTSGGVNHFFKVFLPGSIKSVASDAFDPGVIIETPFPHGERWFVSTGTKCIKEMISCQDLRNNIIRAYDGMSRGISRHTKGLIIEDELRRVFSEELYQGFYKFLDERGIRFDVTHDNWLSFTDDYRLWLQGSSPKSGKDIPWLRLSRTRDEAAIWEQANHEGQPAWAKYYVELPPKDKSSLFELMNAFDLPVDYFEPAANDVVFDERKPAGIPSGSYGVGDPFVIYSNWSDADRLLQDSVPIGKTFSIVSDLDLKATVKITEKTDCGNPVFIGEGTIAGYTTNRVRQLKISAKDGSIISINYVEYPEDADYYAKFPLWQKLIEYRRYKQRIWEKTLDNLILRFCCAHKA